MACEARAARGSLIYILEMISLRIEPRNFEDYLYITISYISFHLKHYLVVNLNFIEQKCIAIYILLIYNQYN